MITAFKIFLVVDTYKLRNVNGLKSFHLLSKVFSEALICCLNDSLLSISIPSTLVFRELLVFSLDKDGVGYSP